MEKRKHMRLPIQVAVELRLNESKPYRGTTVNLSFGGAFINLLEQPECRSGDICHLTLLLQEKPCRIDIKFRCYIVRAEKKEVALNFRSLDIEDYNHFKQLMVSNSQDPNRLLEELRLAPGLEVKG